MTSLRQKLEARSHGICEKCRQARATHKHHKKGRGRQDSDHLENLAHLCTFCHNYVHSHPQESYEQGWMIKRGA